MSDGKGKEIETFARGPFKPHGRISMWTEGAVVHVHAEGPFNVEAMIALGRAYQALFAEQQIDGLFGDIVEFRRSLMCSPDVLEAYGQFMRANSASGRTPVAVAWVVPADVEGRAMMLPMYKRLYDALGRCYAVFETAAEAEAWLRERLAEAGRSG